VLRKGDDRGLGEFGELIRHLQVRNRHKQSTDGRYLLISAKISFGIVVRPLVAGECAASFSMIWGCRRTFKKIDFKMRGIMECILPSSRLECPGLRTRSSLFEVVVWAQLDLSALNVGYVILAWPDA
jgi:hypothetical protein